MYVTHNHNTSCMYVKTAGGGCSTPCAALHTCCVVAPKWPFVARDNALLSKAHAQARGMLNLLPAPAAAPIRMPAMGAGMQCTLCLVAMVKHLNMPHVPCHAAVSLYGGVAPEAERTMRVFAAVGGVRAALCMAVASRFLIARFISAANVCAARLVHARRLRSAVAKLAARAGQAVLVGLEVVLGAGLEIVVLGCSALDGEVVLLRLTENCRNSEGKCQETPSSDAHRHPAAGGFVGPAVLTASAPLLPPAGRLDRLSSVSNSTVLRSWLLRHVSRSYKSCTMTYRNAMLARPTCRSSYSLSVRTSVLRVTQVVPSTYMYLLCKLS